MLQDFKYSDGFASVESVDMGLMVGTSFSIFFLWIEFILYLRLISKIAIYIYYDSRTQCSFYLRTLIIPKLI
ncbi:unnamed protein product [Rhizophagus irregularis]|nr:unnamed protein product [Rhizophagus irregularis]